MPNYTISDFQSAYATLLPRYNDNVDKYEMYKVYDPVLSPATIKDVRLNDIQQMYLNQNTLYMFGTITCATLLIAAIMIANE
jgi:hypothetical protein